MCGYHQVIIFLKCRNYTPPFLVLFPSFCPTERTEDDVEREARLVEQWVGLTEERNAVLVPAPGSGIPGAPADWYVHPSFCAGLTGWLRWPVARVMQATAQDYHRKC